MNDFSGRIDYDATGSPESVFVGGPIQLRPDKAREATRSPTSHHTIRQCCSCTLKMTKRSRTTKSSFYTPRGRQKVGVELRWYEVVGGDFGFRNPTKETPE